MKPNKLIIFLFFLIAIPAVWGVGVYCDPNLPGAKCVSPTSGGGTTNINNTYNNITVYNLMGGNVSGSITPTHLIWADGNNSIADIPYSDWSSTDGFNVGHTSITAQQDKFTSQDFDILLFGNDDSIYRTNALFGFIWENCTGGNCRLGLRDRSIISGYQYFPLAVSSLYADALYYANGSAYNFGGSSSNITNLFKLNETNNVTQTTLIPDGTASSPSVQFSSDKDGTGTGFYRSATNRIGVSANGVFIGQFLSTGFEMDSALVYSFNNRGSLGASANGLFRLSSAGGANINRFILGQTDGTGSALGFNLTRIYIMNGNGKNNGQLAIGYTPYYNSSNVLDVNGTSSFNGLLNITGNTEAIGNVTTYQFYKTNSITLPACSTSLTGSIGSNSSGTYGCNSTDWVRLF